jgi:hypothetical protein
LAISVYQRQLAVSSLKAVSAKKLPFPARSPAASAKPDFKAFQRCSRLLKSLESSIPSLNPQPSTINSIPSTEFASPKDTTTLLHPLCPAGQFGADMQVALCNDGPVTIIIDSRARE